MANETQRAGVIGLLLRKLGIRGRAHGGDDAIVTTELADIEFLVAKMVCEGCAEKVASILAEVAGVRTVRPNVGSKRVYVQYERSKVGEEDLRNALASAGFAAKEG